LEQHAGFQTVLAVKIEQHKDEDSITHAKVQFTDKKSVETILNLVTSNKHLSYINYVLNATLIKPGILSKPRIFAYNMEGIGIHFGCQTSKGKLNVLWEHSNASVKFGARLRKMYIFFHY
jgi:RNA-dependent RNA polymerase